MKYLRVAISDERQSPLYQRDFTVRELLEPLVRRLIEQLVDQNLVFQGEHIGCVMIPRYGDLMRKNPTVVMDPERARSYESSFSLSFEEPVQPDTPLKYLTCELRVRERGVIYRADFALNDLRGFWSGLELGLVQLSVLQRGQTYRRRLYARDDEQARIGVDDVFAWRQDDTPLVEIMSDTPVAPVLARRSLGDFPVEERVTLELLGDGATDPEAWQARGGVEVLITRPTLEAVRAVARSGASVEEGGVLVGHVYERDNASGYLVEITDHIKSEGTFASVTELRYTFESWQKQTAVLKERFPGKRIVGWYHTHLVRMGVLHIEGSQGTLFDTGLFFSRDDHFMHRQFFREKWYVALVLDTEATAAFFCWSGDEIVPNPSYVITSQEGAA